MKTKHSIRMDFNKANRQRDKLRETARDIERYAGEEMENCLSRISQSWQGDNANAYIAKGRAVAANLRAIARDLRKTADTIDMIAANTYQAEKRALELAEQRK